MGASELLYHLRGAGLVLTVTPAGGLHVAPRSALTDHHRSAIITERDALVLALQLEASEEASSHVWALHFPDTEPLVAASAPAETHAQVLARHPGALAARPVPEPSRLALPAEMVALIDDYIASDLYGEEDRETLEAMYATDPASAQVLLAEMHARIGRCYRCQHFTRPGLSDGYCTGREDLAHAYGFMHDLPPDMGAWCNNFKDAT